MASLTPARARSRSSRPRKVQARGVATRERLLAAAEGVFTAHGYDGASMQDVAKRAGASVGTLYHHFPDKHSLLLELVDRYGDRVARERRTDLEFDAILGDSPRRGFHLWLRAGYEQLLKKPSLYLLILGLADRDPEVRRRYQRVEQLAVERMRGLLEFAKQRGAVRADADTAAAAFLIHHAIDMAATQLLVREVVDPSPDRVLEELADMICRYILEEQR